MRPVAQHRNPDTTLLLMTAVVLGGVSSVTAMLAIGSPLILVGFCVVTSGLWLISRSVDWATYGVCFCLFANLAVIAVKFHGVPALAAHAIMGLLAIPLIYYVLIERQPLVVGPCFPWLVIMAAVQGLGVLFAAQPLRASEDLVTFLIEGVVLYLLVVNVVRTPECLRGVTWSLCLAGMLMGGFPLIQQLTGDFDNQFGGLAQTPDEPGFLGDDGESVQRRMAGPIGEKNRYAQVMLMLVPLSLFRLRDERSQAMRMLAVIAVCLSAAGVYLSFSRSAIVCAGMVVGLAAVLGHVNRTRIAIAAAVVLCGLLLTPQYRARLASLADLCELSKAGKHSQADGALKGRATEMGAAALVFLDYPIIGVGPGEFKYYSREYGERIGIRALAPQRQAHCLPLDVAAENGLLGLCCLLCVFSTSGLTLLRQISGDPADHRLQSLRASYFYMLAVYATTGLFLHFAFIRYFWLMIALGDAAIRMGAIAQQSNHSHPAQQRLELLVTPQPNRSAR